MVEKASIAIVHDELMVYSGAERVLAALMELWPEAPVFVLVGDPGWAGLAMMREKKLRLSPLQKLPLARRRPWWHTGLMPMAVEQFDMSGFDVVISNSRVFAKGAMTTPDQLHISYTYTPGRYAWERWEDGRRAGKGGKRGRLVKLMSHYLRMWEAGCTQRVDQFVVKSREGARWLAKLYGREAKVIYPPVEVEKFRPQEHKEDYYLTVSRLVPAKRLEVIVAAFRAMPNRNLVVIGEGPERKALVNQAGSNVRFLGYQPDRVLRGLMATARAFVSAPVGDFSIAALESQACGTPVVALRGGGTVEAVVEEKTGIFYEEASAKSVIATINQFERSKAQFEPANLRWYAEMYNKARFKQEMRELVEGAWEEFVQETNGGAAHSQ